MPEAALRSVLAGLEPRPQALCVAFSGGCDSTALLAAATSYGRAAGLPVRAVHVNHGLQDAAAGFEAHCVEACRALSVPLQVLHVAVSRVDPRGLEAAARAARYEILLAQLAEGELLLTAHHLDDQAETVLLHLMRGSGAAGLAGISATGDIGGHRIVRPLLPLRRADLERYARSRGLTWVHDPQNDDLARDRNFIRARVLPELTARWPSAAGSIGRSAALMAESAALQQDLAAADAHGLVDGAGRIALVAFVALPDRRQRNLLRYLVTRRGWPPIPEARLRAGLAQLVGAGADRQPVLRWGSCEIRRYRDHLHLRQTDPVPVLPAVTNWDGRSPLELGPGLGRLQLEAVAGLGFRRVPEAPLEVRFRAGGETIRPAGDRHRRTFKYLLQAQGVVPWMRSRLPVIYQQGRIVAVADLWIAAEAAAGDGEAGHVVRWTGHPPIR